MIGFLRGILVKKHPPVLLMDVQGVGYEVEAPMTTFYALPETGHEIELCTHLVVREDAHLLFGFATENERHLFRTLIKINGVGAKMALAILSGIETNEFTQCIQNSDTARLIKLPGIGKKMAERLIVEMRDRLDSLPSVSKKTDNNISKINHDAVDDAVSALIGLGYKLPEASRYVLAVATDSMSSEELIRKALKHSLKK